MARVYDSGLLHETRFSEKSHEGTFVQLPSHELEEMNNKPEEEKRLLYRKTFSQSRPAEVSSGQGEACLASLQGIQVCQGSEHLG